MDIVLKNIGVVDSDALQVTASNVSSLTDAIRESVVLALLQNRTVALQYSNARYLVRVVTAQLPVAGSAKMWEISVAKVS